jgi:nucleoside-diphosphate-sugar epimerase
MDKIAVVCGAGGFIGGHLVTRLKCEGYYVVGADIKDHEFKLQDADEFYKIDLRIPENVNRLIGLGVDEVYQLAADMGGAGFCFTGENDADIMHNSAQINLNVLDRIRWLGSKPKVFYSSSACVYNNPDCTEDSVYPANPDSEYGWEKLFSERLYLAFSRNYDIPVRIARFHNIFGPLGTYKGGREKVPAALCRKICEANDFIEIWGDGEQTRSFLYIDECIKGIRKLMESDFSRPINIGSEETVSINQLADMIMKIACKELQIKHIDGPMGVRDRTSNNKLIKEKLGWEPTQRLMDGLIPTYKWIKEML